MERRTRKRCRGGDVEEMGKESEMENLRQKTTAVTACLHRDYSEETRHTWQLLGHNSKKTVN